MHRFSMIAAMLIILGFSLPGTADERPEHFEGKPAETLEQAVQNFSAANEELAALLAREELDAKDLHEVHKLTYTLENALERIREDLDGLAQTLEEVHLASETTDAETVKSRGHKYLETARTLVK